MAEHQMSQIMPSFTIHCGFPESRDGPSGVGLLAPWIVFCVNSVEGDLVFGTFCFAIEDLSVNLPATFSGWDLHEFIEQLERFHQTLEGSAKLIDFSHLVHIVLAVANPARGAIKISATVGIYFPEFSPTDRGVEFTVDGLMTEQSYLPGLVREISQLIEETGVIVKDPWSED